MGLLSSVGNSIGGLLGKEIMGIPAGVFLGIPQSKEHLQAMIVGPDKMAERERQRRQAELEQMQIEAARMQMAQAKKSQQKDDITGAMIQSMNAQLSDAMARYEAASRAGQAAQQAGDTRGVATAQAEMQKAESEVAALRSPQAQNLFRGHLATQGNPQMAEQAGLIAPVQQEQATSKMREYEFARQNGYNGSFTDFMQLGQVSAQPPANIQEWDRFSRMTPEEQARYLQMKRADRWLDTGGANVRIDPVTGMPAYEVPNTLPPKDQAERDASAASNVMTINELRSIIEPGGLLDQSTGSGVGAARDAVAGMFGKSTTGAEAIAQLRPIAHRVLMNVPRFSGPQSDRDVQAYREAAGQVADPTLPVPIRKAAVRTIIDLMEKAQQYSPPPSQNRQLMSPVPGSSPAQNPADARLEALRQKYGL